MSCDLGTFFPPIPPKRGRGPPQYPKFSTFLFWSTPNFPNFPNFRKLSFPLSCLEACASPSLGTFHAFNLLGAPQRSDASHPSPPPRFTPLRSPSAFGLGLRVVLSSNAAPSATIAPPTRAMQNDFIAITITMMIAIVSVLICLHSKRFSLQRTLAHTALEPRHTPPPLRSHECLTPKLHLQPSRRFHHRNLHNHRRTPSPSPPQSHPTPLPACTSRTSTTHTHTLPPIRRSHRNSHMTTHPHNLAHADTRTRGHAVASRPPCFTTNPSLSAPPFFCPRGAHIRVILKPQKNAPSANSTHQRLPGR